MSRLSRELGRIARELDRVGARWALIGGLGVSARTEARFTRDIDLAVAVADDREAERLVTGLTRLGYRVLLTLEHEALGRLATVRVLPPGQSEEGVVVDLLFASSGIEPEIVAAAERLEVSRGVVIPVASAGALLALKILSRDDGDRPQDLADIRALRRVAGAAALAETRRLLAAIHARGADRGRDLLGAWDELLAERDR